MTAPHIESILRQAWPDLSQDFELRFVHSSHVRTADGPLNLQEYRVREPKIRRLGEYEYSFTAGRRKADGKDVVYMLIDPTERIAIYVCLDE